jgi:hypothetical protein
MDAVPVLITKTAGEPRGSPAVAFSRMRKKSASGGHGIREAYLVWGSVYGSWRIAESRDAHSRFPAIRSHQSIVRIAHQSSHFEAC